MTRSAKVTLEWADGEHVFRLGIAQLEELDELCGVGPGFALGQILAGVHGNWKAKMLREVIRIGLVGGGKTPAEASRLTKRYVDERPIGESLLVAQMALQACIVGVEDDMPGEARGEGTDATPSPTDDTALPTSTEPELSPDLALKMLAAAASGSSPPTSPAGGRRTARRPRADP